MRLPTLKVASALLRTNTEGVCSSLTSVTSSSALMTAAAFLPRKVQPRPGADDAGDVAPDVAAERAGQPGAVGQAVVVDARSRRYQLTP